MYRLRLLLPLVLLAVATPALAQPAVDRLEEQIRQQPAPAPAANPQPGYLGAILDDRQVEDGVAVLDVMVNGPAEQAGLKVGDTIVGVNNKPVRRIDDMEQFVRGSAAGTKLTFRVRRGEEQREIAVSLGVRPPVAERPFPDFGRIPEPPAAEAPPGPRLGVRARTLDARSRQTLRVPVGRGAIIEEVIAGSPAADAGLPRGAVIIALDGRPVDTREDLDRLVQQAQPGSEIELSYYQGPRLFRQVVSLGGATPDAQRIADLEARVRALEARLAEAERALRQLTLPPPAAQP